MMMRSTAPLRPNTYPCPTDANLRPPTAVCWCREAQRFERWVTAHRNGRRRWQCEHRGCRELESLQHNAKLPIAALRVEPAVTTRLTSPWEAAECRIIGHSDCKQIVLEHEQGRRRGPCRDDTIPLPNKTQTTRAGARTRVHGWANRCRPPTPQLPWVGVGRRNALSVG